MTQEAPVYEQWEQDRTKNLFLDLVNRCKEKTPLSFKDSLSEFEALFHLGTIVPSIMGPTEGDYTFCVTDYNDQTSGQKRITVAINPILIYLRLHEFQPDRQSSLESTFVDVIHTTLDLWETISDGKQEP